MENGRSLMKEMKENNNKEKLSVSIKTIGRLIGGSVAVAILAGIVYHRRAIKRLIEINQM
jgi:hypothetical protein